MFALKWTSRAITDFERIKSEGAKKKGSRQAGLLKQVTKALEILSHNPRHPGLQTHAYSRLQHPWSPKEKVFEAYAQNRTPGAYRVMWCYGPESDQITILAIIPHP